MAVGFAGKERGATRDKKHADGKETEEESGTGAVQPFTRAAAPLRLVVPVVSVAVTAGAFVGRRPAPGTVVAIVHFVVAAVKLRWCESGRHGIAPAQSLASAYL